MNPNSSDRIPQTIAPKDRLSCKLCQRRKVGCDKGDPCGTCRRAGVKCELSARQRLPRGRNGGRKRADAELKERIGKLEAMVTSMGSVNPGSGTQTACPASEARSSPHSPHSPSESSNDRDMTRYLGSSFWDSLSTEVNGLREVLDEESESDADSPEAVQPIEPPSVNKSPNFNFVLCGPDSFMMAPGALQHPPQPIIDQLLTLYFENVNPVFMIHHEPSIRGYLQGGKPYLGHGWDDPAVKALSFAIFYSAIVTIDDDECKTLLGEEKAALRKRYRFAVEVSLAQADFINSQDITTLQAFAIMLLTARVDDNTRTAWTLLALAVRIAHAMGLQRESTSSSARPFDIEMRRRLWHSIRILDAHASNDRGSDPIIPDPEYNTRLPLNINDADISPDSIQWPAEKEGITDMTLALMLQSSTKYFWRLTFVPHANFERPPLPLECDWDLRQQEAETWHQHVQEKYLRYCDTSVPLQWAIKQLGTNLCQLARLTAMRPMQRHPAAKPPTIDSEWVVKCSLELLEGGDVIYGEPAFKRWRWYIWVQWHPLAVILAELCTYTDGPLVEQAWQAVEVTYNRFVDLVADSRRGMLWRPIEKLYKKAKANRAAKQADSKSRDLQHRPTFHDLQGPPPALFQPDSLSGMQQLSVSEAVQDWNPEAPADMAWLDWATFAEDVTDFNMIDPIDLMHVSDPGLTSYPLTSVGGPAQL